MSFSVQGYQTAPSPSNSHMHHQQQQQPQSRQKSEQVNSSSSGGHHLAAADYSKASGVIVGPGDRMDRDSLRSDPRDQIQHQRSSYPDMQPRGGGLGPDPRDLQRLDPRDQRPPALSYKPYEQTHRQVSGSGGGSGNSNNNNANTSGGNNTNSSSGGPNIRSSRSPHPQMTPPTSSASSYPIHYAGPGPGPGPGPSQHSSYSPSPTGGVGGGGNRGGGTSSGPSPSNYMPPPSVSPSRSPAAHVPPYPAMRYSPAPQTAPIPCTSPSAKKTSPSPLQQQQHQNMALGGGNGGPTGGPPTHYGRPIAGGPQVMGPAGISSGTPVCRPSDQTLPLSLITPSKSAAAAAESAPPPAHTARNTSDRDRERELRERERDVRIYPHTAFSPLAHQLPPPQPLMNPVINSRGGSVAGPPPAMHPQIQPLDLGTYREDSPIPLISSARLSTGESQAKKTRPEQSAPQQPPPPPLPPQIAMPAYPSLGPVVGFPGAPLMSVAALIDAGYTTSGAGAGAQVKPASSNNNPVASAFALGLTPRHPSDTSPPLVVASAIAPVSCTGIDRAAEAGAALLRPVVIKNELGMVEVPPISSSSVVCQQAVDVERLSLPLPHNRSPSLAPAVVVKQEELKQVEQESSAQPTSTQSSTWNAGSVLNSTSTTSSNNPSTTTATASSNNNGNTNSAPSSSSSAKPVHKLKKAWIQRHTGKLISFRYDTSF